jgi:hypothetical protein
MRWRRSMALPLFALAALACGGRTVGAESGGADGGGDDGALDASSVDAGYTKCTAPNGDSLCGTLCGDQCGMGCVGGVDDGYCSKYVGDCLSCTDGHLCVGKADTPPALDCADEEIGVLLARNGEADHVRYADFSAYTGAPIPPAPAQCPSIPGLDLCGGACGECPAGFACIGRSPLHPISTCFRINSYAPWPITCQSSADCSGAVPGCFHFVVDPASQPLADAYGFCVSSAKCAAAGQYPGGAKCQM